jgi:hypothetical protein
MDLSLRQLRHDLRGDANTMVLCASALSLVDNQDERLEIIDEIVQSADKLLAVLDQLEATPGNFTTDGNGVNAGAV